MAIPDGVFECIKLFLHEGDHEKNKKHPVDHQKKEANLLKTQLRIKLVALKMFL